MIGNRALQPPPKRRCATLRVPARCTAMLTGTYVCRGSRREYAEGLCAGAPGNKAEAGSGFRVSARWGLDVNENHVATR